MKRRALWTVPILLIATAVGSGTAQAGLPSGVTAVAVTQGIATPNINGHLHLARTISGTIKTSAGKPVSGFVQAFLNGHSVGGATVTNGTYKITGLFPKSYAVCLSGGSVFNPTSSTGFLGKCYKNAAFNGFTVPSHATLVSVAAHNRAGINFTVSPAAGISGKVTSPSGAGLPNVSVQAYNKSTKALFFGATTHTGTYVITGLTAAAKGYAVCFNAFGATSGTGYLPRCFKNKAWSGTLSSMAGGTTVAVALGHIHRKINQALPRGAAIAGKVVDAGNGKPLAGDGVVVFTATGRFVSSAGTNSKGAYVVRGLATSKSYRVCASPTNVSNTVLYHGRCWKAIAWNGGRLPRGTNAVSARVGRTHTGINFRLVKTVIKFGSIAGTVTEKAHGQPLQFASVSVFTKAGTLIRNASTDAAGHYTVTNLPRSTTGYRVCASQSFAFSTTPKPTGGWAPRCYVDAPWNGGAAPTAAHVLTLAAGQHRTGVNIALHVGGAITGTTFQFGGSTPATSVQVKVFTTSGRLINSTSSGFSDGVYTVDSLSPGHYVVCFDGRQSFTGGPGFLPQCYNGVAWSG